MRYRLIGIDLDGTLLHGGRVSDANCRAIAAAQQTGALVAPCTGRSWRESSMALPAFAAGGERQIGIFVTGATVAQLATGRSLDICVLEPHLALQLVEMLADLPEAVLVLYDPNLTGHDYLVTGRGTLTGNTQMWFASTGATVRFQRSIGLEELHNTLRVGIVAGQRRVEQISRRLCEAFGARIILQSFMAIAADHGEPMFVLEIFAAGVDKWRGLTWIAQQRGIGVDEIAVIGDGTNDLAAISAAGCGIAMANSCPEILAVADHVTLDCEQDGVAHAIEQILTGRWD